MYLIGSERLQAGVWADGVVEVDVAPDGCSGLADRLVGVQVDLFIFDRLPNSLDEYIVTPAATTVHTDSDPFFF